MGDDQRMGRGSQGAGGRWLVGLMVLSGVIGLSLAGLGVVYLLTGLDQRVPGDPAADVLGPDGGPATEAAGPGADQATRRRLDPDDATSGPLEWHEAAPGFETAELPVLIDGVEVERILLARVDPSRFRFEVVSRPAADRDVVDWLDASGAVLAVNGSYFDEDGEPVAPVVSSGEPAGPGSYDGSHGVFVATTSGGAETAAVVDLAGTTWEEAVAGAHDAMVSFPLLVGDDGTSRTGHVDPGKRAFRSFVAQDGARHIVIGTTTGTFFSLDRLGPFLAGAPLDLVTALNLDGGPFACQAVRLGNINREICGQLAIGGSADEDGQGLARDLFPGLPLVLLAIPIDG